MGGRGAHPSGVSMARLRSSGGWRRSSTPNGKAEAGGDFLRFEGRNTIIMHEPIWKKRNARVELTEGGGGEGMTAVLGSNPCTRWRAPADFSGQRRFLWLEKVEGSEMGRSNDD
jgi:hypothetical protein